jgi:predicted GNAT family acetyltransferase
MEFDLDQVQITHNESAHRFEAEVHGLTALIVYRIQPGRMIIQHTEVPPELEARGLAAKLTRAALEYARSKKFQVVPSCPYTAAYIAKHPEYSGLLSSAQ